MVKNLQNQWVMNDRSGSWLKMKPDYQEGVEIDALIIGGLYGTGRHGAQLSQFILGLAEAPPSKDDPPTRFLTFCRVGIGLDDASLRTIREKLQGNLEEASSKRPPPRCYITTGSRDETPNMWVKDPTKSVVLQIKADVRLIQSINYATHHSLRFPRVERVRYDKSYMDIQTNEGLWEYIQQNKGAILDGKGPLEEEDGKREERGGRPRSGKNKTPAKPAAKQAAVVGAFRLADTSAVVKRSDALKGHDFCILNTTPQHQRTQLEKDIVALGGKVWANAVKKDMRVVAARKDFMYDAAVRKGHNILSLDWLLECIKGERLVPPQPHHFLHLSKEHLHQLPDVDRFGDLYYEDIQPCDVRMIATSHARLEDIRLPDLAPRTPDETESAAAARISAHLPPRRGEVYTALDASMDVEAQLRERSPERLGMAPLLGCQVVLLHLPEDASATGHEQEAVPPATSLEVQSVKESAVALQAAQVARIKNQLGLLGARVLPNLGPTVTHVLVVLPRLGEEGEALQRPVEARHLLEKLWDSHGGTAGLFFLRKALALDSVQFVNVRWLEEKLVSGATGRMDKVATFAPPDIFRPHIVVEGVKEDGNVPSTDWGTSGWEKWPWEVFGVSSKGKGASRTGQSHSRSPSRSHAERGEEGESVVSKRSARGRARGCRGGAAQGRDNEVASNQKGTRKRRRGLETVKEEEMDEGKQTGVSKRRHAQPDSQRVGRPRVRRSRGRGGAPRGTHSADGTGLPGGNHVLSGDRSPGHREPMGQPVSTGPEESDALASTRSPFDGNLYSATRGARDPGGTLPESTRKPKAATGRKRKSHTQDSGSETMEDEGDGSTPGGTGDAAPKESMSAPRRQPRRRAAQQAVQAIRAVQAQLKDSQISSEDGADWRHASDAAVSHEAGSSMSPPHDKQGASLSNAASEDAASDGQRDERRLRIIRPLQRGGSPLSDRGLESSLQGEARPSKKTTLLDANGILGSRMALLEDTTTATAPEEEAFDVKKWLLPLSESFQAPPHPTAAPEKTSLEDARHLPRTAGLGDAPGVSVGRPGAEEAAVGTLREAPMEAGRARGAGPQAQPVSLLDIILEGGVLETPYLVGDRQLHGEAPLAGPRGSHADKADPALGLDRPNRSQGGRQGNLAGQERHGSPGCGPDAASPLGRRRGKATSPGKSAVHGGAATAVPRDAPLLAGKLRDPHAADLPSGGSAGRRPAKTPLRGQQAASKGRQAPLKGDQAEIEEGISSKVDYNHSVSGAVLGTSLEEAPLWRDPGLRGSPGTEAVLAADEGVAVPVVAEPALAEPLGGRQGDSTDSRVAASLVEGSPGAAPQGSRDGSGGCVGPIPMAIDRSERPHDVTESTQNVASSPPDGHERTPDVTIRPPEEAGRAWKMSKRSGSGAGRPGKDEGGVEAQAKKEDEEEGKRGVWGGSPDALTGQETTPVRPRAHHTAGPDLGVPKSDVALRLAPGPPRGITAAGPHGAHVGRGDREPDAQAQLPQEGQDGGKGLGALDVSGGAGGETAQRPKLSLRERMRLLGVQAGLKP
eukprot:jgi/Botrbrau1/6878/Bobra.152_2s0034.1